MRSYDGPEHSTGHALARAHTPEPPQRTPADHARDAVDRAAGEVRIVTLAAESIRSAHAANDPVRWQEERETAERLLASVDRLLERARARQNDASADAAQRFASAERSLSDARAAIAMLVEPPLGWTTVSRETQILSILEGGITGSARAGFDAQERALKVELSHLPASESRVLADRISKARPSDPIATRVARMIPERRGRLLAFLADARRREAIQAARQPQRKAATTAAPPTNADEVAAEGVVTASSPLPFLSQIQHAFGKHDVSGVRAQVGGPADKASKQLGARAYALGERVAFAGTPDLHTAAHEAAHVVQQRRGARGPEDAHERAADEVADTVVAGRSAEELLDREETGSSQAVLQRKADPRAGTKPVPAWEYLKDNNARFVDAIQRRVATIVPPTNDRLVWTAGGLGIAFPEALYSALGADVLFIKLAELSYPVDPWYVIDANRTITDGTAGVVSNGKEATGPGTWSPLVGDALAVTLAKCVRESLDRMTGRYLVQLDTSPTVTLANLVASHPMDRVTARLLLDERVVRPVAPRRAANQKRTSNEPSLFRDGVRFLADWHWVPDPALWNWIEVVDPRDATVEEVAASLWTDPNQSQRAYGITAAAPFFRIDPKWARMFEEPKSRAPQGTDQPHEDNALVLAESARATDVAIAQVAGERKVDKRGALVPPDLQRLGKLLDQSQRQIERAATDLNASPLRPLVYPAYHWVARYREHLLSIPDHKLVELTPVIEGQQTILYEAVGAIAELIRSTGRASAVEGKEGAATHVIRQYAIAAGESHLVATARTQLAIAKRARSELPLALLEESLHESDQGDRELAANESRMQWGGDRSAAASQVGAYHRRLVAMRGAAAAGKAVDEGDVALLAAELKDHAFEAQAKTLYLQLHNLSEEARDAKTGFSGAIASLGRDVSRLPETLNAWLTDISTNVLVQRTNNRKKRHLDDAPPPTNARDKAARAVDIEDAIGAPRRELGRLTNKESPLWQLISDAVAQIERQRVRAAWVDIVTQIAVLIGVSIASGGAASVAAGAVRGALLADAATSAAALMRGARLARTVGTLTELGIDAGLNAAGQVLISGDGFASSFGENFVTNAVVRAALAPLQKAAAAWRTADKDLANLAVWERRFEGAKLTLKAGTILTAEMIAGAGVSYMVQRALHDGAPDEKTAAQWTLEGASMAVGAFIGRKLKALEERLVQLAEHGTHVLRQTRRARGVARRAEAKGDPDAALEVMADHERLLEEEGRLLDDLRAHPHPAVSATTLDTLAAGNRAEHGSIQGKAFQTMPLRFAGLEPDDASGKTWSGTTEDIGVALHQANRSGLSVEVLDHDTAAGQWKVRYQGEELTILETKREGRPRSSKEAVTEVDREHARRYAAAAEWMEQQWIAKTKREIAAMKVPEFDHIQGGGAVAGVINQATLPVTGEKLNAKLVVFRDEGPLTGRGKQGLGQDPRKWDAPGVRATEQTPHGARWLSSEELKRALDIGRIESQTPLYRGTITDLQARSNHRPNQYDPRDTWEAPHRAFRVRVHSEGSGRWFYCDRFDIAGGMGPADMSALTKGLKMDANLVAEMLGRGQLLAGDDPEYLRKVRAGRVLIWGGSPTGAWAAELSVRVPGSHVTVMGDSRSGRSSSGESWPELVGKYEDVMQQIAAHQGHDVPADLVRKRDVLEARIAEAHKGMTLDRNRAPGTTYDRSKPLTRRKPGDVQIEFGTPSQLTPLPNGRVEVTVGKGDDARSTIYDQVVIAHGQDPSSPGAPGGLLGPGAVEAVGRPGDLDEVPAGTVALRPVFTPAAASREPELVGLESVDPEGIRLLGAAYASKKMLPWIKASERAAFGRAIDRMAAERARTRDHGAISSDSTGVTTGIEHQRDKLPRANEILAARAYRLPGPEHTLHLDPANRSRWDDQVREFFTVNLRAEGKWVSIKRLTDGADDAITYQVWIDASEVGVFKLFERGGAANEQAMLELLRDAKLTSMRPVRERGTIAIDPKTGFDGALLMDATKGASVKQLIESIPSDQTQRKAAFAKLQVAITSVAEGLAEMHAKLEGGAHMTRGAKDRDANRLLERSFRDGGRDAVAVRAALGDHDFQRVKSAIEGPVLEAFRAADVPATASHGNASADHFMVGGKEKLEIVDVGTMRWSIDEQTRKGTSTSAADVGRFLESLEVSGGRLTTSELAALESSFTERYFERYQKRRGTIDRRSMSAAEKWYRLEFEIETLVRDHMSKERILRLLELESTP